MSPLLLVSFPSNNELPPMMGISLTFTLIAGHLLVLGLLIRVLFTQLQRQDDIIKETRLREQQLIDKLLTKAGYSPLIEREQVVKIPDPEIRQPDFIELAFREDAIMEEVEVMNPDMQGTGRGLRKTTVSRFVE
jgi:hypothetical protein